MKSVLPVLLCLFLWALSLQTFAAGPFSVKNKKTSAIVKVKDTGALLLPGTQPPSSNLYIMLFNPSSGALLDGPHSMTAKVKRKTGEVKMWYHKEKNHSIIKYKPSRRTLLYKVWQTLPDTVLLDALTQDMVCVPSGTFVMGNSKDVSEGNPDEQPVHTVKIDSFFMDSCEVSNGDMRDVLQWAYDNGKVIADNTTVRNVEGDQQELLDLDGPECQINFSFGKFSVVSGKTNYPCVEVTWYGACAFCNLRSEREGKTPCYNFSSWSCDWTANGYRLPTEAEWEKAVRGGHESNRFAWASIQIISHTYANYMSTGSLSYDASGNAGYHPVYNTGTTPYTNPGGAFEANGYGLHDMPGNVWEWCWDRYSATYYAGSPIHNPRGPVLGTTRILRGGSWKEYPGYCRAADRGDHVPTGSFNHFGFRCVKQ